MAFILLIVVHMKWYVWLLILTSTVASGKSIDLSTTVGFGVSSLGLSLSGVEYSVTNQNFTFLNLAYKKISLTGKVPNPDKDAVRRTSVDTKITDIQFDYAFTGHWQAEISHQKYTGYYAHRSDTILFRDSDLSLRHDGLQISYTLNPAYSFSALGGLSSEQAHSATSVVATLGADQFSIEGDITPTSTNTGLNSDLASAFADSLSASIGYGANWIGDSWFGGMFGSYGLSYNRVRYSYAGANAREGHNNDTQSVVGIKFVAGYQKNFYKLGFYGKTASWRIVFDDKDLSSMSSSSGLYASYIF